MLPETQEGPTRSLALDSALIVTALGALLYFVGMSFRMARLTAIGVPLDFVRQWSLQEYLLTGGVALALLIPAIMIVDVTLVMFPTLRPRLANSLRATSNLRLAVLVVYAVFLVTVPLVPIARLLAHTDVHYRVVEAIPKPGVTLGAAIKGAYYVSSTEHEIVLSDKWADPDAKIIVVTRDSLSEVVLSKSTP